MIYCGNVKSVGQNLKSIVLKNDRAAMIDMILRSGVYVFCRGCGNIGAKYMGRHLVCIKCGLNIIADSYNVRHKKISQKRICQIIKKIKSEGEEHLSNLEVRDIILNADLHVRSALEMILSEKSEIIGMIQEKFTIPLRNFSIIL